MAQQQQMQVQQSLVDQAGQLAGAPALDPSKSEIALAPPEEPPQ